MKQVFVTGAAGFIGINLCDALLSEGYRVLGLDSYLCGNPQGIDYLSKKFGASFQFIKKDVNDRDLQEAVGLSLQSAVANANWPKPAIDQVYHLACAASPPVYQNDMLHTLDTCYMGTANVLKLAESMSARILFSSTSECYGDPLEHPQSESYRGNVNTYGPRSCYDEGKRVAESLCYVFEQRGLEVRIVRIFNTYGPWMSPDDGRVVSNFVKQSILDAPLEIYGDGSQTRSICYVDDLVSGLRKLMDSDVRGPTNLGSEFEMTILQLADLVDKAAGKKHLRLFLPLPQDDPLQRRPDLTKARSSLGWEPKVSPEQGIQRLFEDFRSRLMSKNV